MNSDDQQSESLRATLSAKIDEAGSVDEFRSLLDEIERGREQIGVGEAAELARNVLYAIANLTTGLPDVAATVIRDNLFPWCLVLESPDTALERYRFLELLKKWLYEYPHEQMTEIRGVVLREVTQQLKKNPSKELLSVISAIGYRAAELTELLWPLLERDDELSDAALAALSGLGAKPDDRERLLDCVRRRLGQGVVSHGVRVAIQELVGPDQTDLAFDLLRLAAEKHSDEILHDLMRAFSVASQVLDRCADNPQVHDDMWTLLRSDPKLLQMTSTYAYRSNTKDTVVDHINWLLSGQVRGDEVIATYSTLSRLGELAKARQLEGWDTSSTEALIPLLERYAKGATKMKGLYATTDLHAKEEAWESALTLGCPNVADWIDEALMDETNHYAAHSVAKIVACWKAPQLPKRLLDAISVETDSEDEGHMIRQMGLVEIARSSSSRAAFDSLLGFGLTHDGKVLLSTVDAITDVALVRLEEGDTDVVDRVLDTMMPGNEYRHRVAAVSVFCRLCNLGRVDPEYLTRLWEIASEDDLDNYARCEAMEAVGLIDFAAAVAWSDAIRKIAMEDESDFGWRACEVLIRHSWVTSDDEQWLFSRLGLDYDALVCDPKATSGWQAFLIGLLFRQNKDRFSKTLSSLIENAATDAVYQVFESLRHLASACPNKVCESLARRIEVSNDNASTDTEMFKILAEIAPARLLNLSRVCSWTDWLVEARTALCEAIRFTAVEREEYRAEAVACLVPFMRDAAFQVRRSAYRAIATTDVHLLETVCEPWSRSTDVELRKRAVEASEWLPIESHPDDKVAAFGFGWDTERSVREIWKDVLVHRRERCWASDYLDRIFASCEGDDNALPAYRFARALTKLGDDESIKQIEEFVATRSLRPHVKHWLKKTTGDIKKRWKKVTDKWPEPWSHEQGSIEELNGAIVLPEGKRVDVKLSLWCRRRTRQSDHISWGGVAEEADTPLPFGANTDRIELSLPGRPPAFAKVFGSHWSSSSASRLVLRGDGAYPDRPQGNAVGTGSGLDDIVSSAIREAGIDLESLTLDEASQTLQPIIERANIALLNLHSETDVDARLKWICQEAALVTRSLADFLPTTFAASVELWRVVNSILEQGGFALRLSPPELSAFGQTARTGERKSPDDLLEWLLKHVETQSTNEVERDRETEVKPRGQT